MIKGLCQFRALPSSLAAGMFLLFLVFIIIWCAQTTFRAMSDWMLYVINLTMALLLTLPSILARRVWVQILLMCAVALLLEANLMYCRTYLTAIPLESYGLVSNLLDFTASVRDSLRWADLLLVVPVVATALTGYLMPHRCKSDWGTPLPYLALTLLLAIAAGIGLTARGGFMRAYDKLVQSCYYSTCGTPIYTIAGSLAFQALSTPEKLTPEIEALLSAWQTEKESARPWRGVVSPKGARRNLVIILLESFESWPLEARTCAGQEITPYLNSLLADSTTLFRPHMLTQVASGRSIDCQLMLFTGLLPMQNSVWSMRRPNADYPSLVKAMKQDRNARCVIFTCDKPITWNQEAVARSLGYDTLLDRRHWNIDELVGNPAKLSDGSFMRQCVAKMRTDELHTDGAPYLMTFVTYSGHNPFRLPDKLKDPAFYVSGCGYPQRLADYITMAHYTDASLRTLVEYMRSRPDWPETLVLITGDHEGLAGDRRQLLADASARRLVDRGQFTPFIVLNAPETGRSRRGEDVMGQIDMYPTLLDMLGLRGYAWKGIGQNVLDTLRVPAAISSMTDITAGDTTAATPAQLRNLRSARAFSDKLIRLKL